MHELRGPGRPVREHGASARARHDDRRRLPRADRKDRAVEVQDGLDVPLVLELRQSFNFDYDVSFDDTVSDPHYNYRSAAELKAKYEWAELPSELHGTSAFLRVGDGVFHTYSTYGRGTEQVGGTHYYLDMTALGRQEDWEEPKGRAESLGPRADQRAAPPAAGV